MRLGRYRFLISSRTACMWKLLSYFPKALKVRWTFVQRGPKRRQATYEQIKAYVLEQTGLKVSSLYIAQIKKKCGLDVGENFNLPKSENARQPQCTPEKEEAIMQAFRHFGII